MMKKKIAAIDIGTTKVCTIMGTVDSASGLRILGVGVAPSRGIEKALVADSIKARESIRESILKAQVMAGYRLQSAYIGVTGRHITSMNNKGAIAISHRDTQVREEDMRRALEVAASVRLQPEQKVLHIIPRSYRLDGFEVKNPIGMNGAELEVEVHIIIASTNSVQDLTKVIRGLGVSIDDLILEPLASAEAVLYEEEKQAGVLLADMGGGTTDVVIIRDGSILHTGVIPAAGHYITMDLSTGLGLSYELAEEMKKKYGTLMKAEYEDPDRTVGDDGGSVSFQALREIMQIRVQEIIRLMIMNLPGRKAGVVVPAGLVLTGGCANIPGMVEFVQKFTDVPVRLGIPAGLTGVSIETLKNPAYATSVGLLLWAMKNKGTSHWVDNQPKGLRSLVGQLLNLFR